MKYYFLVLFAFLLFCSVVSATTDANVDPDADGVTLEWTPIPSGDHYATIDDGTRQPAVPNLDDYIEINSGAGQDNFADTFYMETLTGVDSVSSIKIWVYGKTGPADDEVHADISLDDGSTWVGSGEIIPESTSSAAWFSKTFNGTWTQAQLNTLHTKLIYKFVGGVAIGDTAVYAMYAEITYEEVVIPEYSLMVFVAVSVASIGIALLIANKK